MALRLHFTTNDVLNTKFSAAPAPLVELTAALCASRDPRLSPATRSWQQETRQRIPRAALPLVELVPPGGSTPLFLDPLVEDVDDALEIVRSVPRSTAVTDLASVFPARAPLTPWIRSLAYHERDSWRRLEEAMGAAYRTVLLPEWADVLACHRADLAVRANIALGGGIRATLAGLLPGASWQDSCLVLPSRADRDVHLEGRGLTLYPSAYWSAGPATTSHPDGSVVLVYPAVAQIPYGDLDVTQEPLSRLLGRTRAAALRCLVHPHTTSDLAAELQISIATASEQAKTLRETGLVATRRAGKAVLHACTPLGLHLLTGGQLSAGAESMATGEVVGAL